MFWPSISNKSPSSVGRSCGFISSASSYHSMCWIAFPVEFDRLHSPTSTTLHVLPQDQGFAKKQKPLYSIPERVSPGLLENPNLSKWDRSQFKGICGKVISRFGTTRNANAYLAATPKAERKRSLMHPRSVSFPNTARAVENHSLQCLLDKPPANVATSAVVTLRRAPAISSIAATKSCSWLARITIPRNPGVLGSV